eukprot:jgi/Phyca11/116545/e_gw1.31.177.1
MIHQGSLQRRERRRIWGDKRPFDASVLETLCESCWGVGQSSVTDEFPQRKAHDITGSFWNQKLPEVKKQFRKEPQLKTSNTDIDAQVIEYFNLCNLLVKSTDFYFF